MTKDEALRLALEALKEITRRNQSDHQAEIAEEAITAIKAALEAKDEPVGKFAKFTDNIWREVTDGSAGVPLYTTPPVGDIRALKHRIHELEGELLGYKKIVADQDAMLERQTARIVDLQTHIENFDGEDR